jgi:hypothetical protein
MIRYYSAPRKETAWTRASDAAMWATLLLAFPAAWIADVSTAKPKPAIAVSGLLIGEDADHLEAWALTDDTMQQHAPEGRNHGRWRLHVTDVHRGWPLTTSVHRQPAQLDLDILSEPRERLNAQLPADDLMRSAIANELDQQEQTEMIAAWRQSGVEVRYEWTNWLIAAAGWWIIMVLASTFTIQIARVITLRVRDHLMLKRSSRAAEGKCVQCGYDLTGLEFNERCPECGTLVW